MSSSFENVENKKPKIEKITTKPPARVSPARKTPSERRSHAKSPRCRVSRRKSDSSCGRTRWNHTPPRSFEIVHFRKIYPQMTQIHTDFQQKNKNVTLIMTLKDWNVSSDSCLSSIAYFLSAGRTEVSRCCVTRIHG